MTGARAIGHAVGRAVRHLERQLDSGARVASVAVAGKSPARRNERHLKVVCNKGWSTSCAPITRPSRTSPGGPGGVISTCQIADGGLIMSSRRPTWRLALRAWRLIEGPELSRGLTTHRSWSISRCRWERARQQSDAALMESGATRRRVGCKTQGLPPDTPGAPSGCCCDLADRSDN